MRSATRIVAGTSLFAAAIIGSSWASKGNLAGECVDAALYLAAGCVLAIQAAPAFPGKCVPKPAHQTTG